MTRRTLIGIVFVLHGLAHSGLGMWATVRGPDWYVVPLWWLAEVGFIIAGLGLLGIPWCRRVWEPAGAVAAVTSILLLQWFGSVALALGLVIDTIVIVLGLRWGESSLVPARLTGRDVDAPPVVHVPRHRLFVLAGTALVLYVAVVIPARGWYDRWGTTAGDRMMTLPGDDLSAPTSYRIDHAVLIRTPADSVWPWLVQVGQGRAGFYSYDKLERLVGADIRNADRVHSEWQVLQQGDVVRATQPNYLGGLLGTPGWRVESIEPRRALVLEDWGAFVLVPRDSGTTLLYVRTRGATAPTLRNTMLAPVSLLVFEPIHFVMERRMLLDIKARAEHRVGDTDQRRS